MFPNLTPWQWVWVAWGELALVYIGYLLYLAHRERRNRQDKESP